MELNLFHRIILAFAFVIMGIGITNSVTKNLIDPYSEIGNVAQKYNIVSFEPVLNETPRFMSRSWLRNMMVSSFIDANQAIDIQDKTTFLLKVNDDNPTKSLYLLAFPEDAPAASIQRDLEQLSVVKYAEPNFDVELQVETVIPSQISPTALTTDTAVTNSVYKVAIIDSGVDVTHKDFQSKKIVTRNLVGNNTDQVGHGTHLAGIILNTAPNVELYSYKFTDGKTGKLSDVIRSMHLALKDEVDLVNLSLGLPTKSFALYETVQLLTQNNIKVVAAAGNLNANLEFYPAAFDEVIAVGGLSSTGSKLASSNFGPWIDYSILGQNIYSTSPGQEYAYLSGTSQSAAFVSGLIANYYLTQDRSQLTLEDFLTSQMFERQDNYTDLLGVRLQN